MGRSGPTIGASKGPHISAAGKDHVIFSKKLLCLIGLVVAVTVFVFFSVEQSRIASNFAASRAAMAQNNAVRDANEVLEQSKASLQEEEDELVAMYSQWLDEDNEEIDITEEELAQLKGKLKAVQGKIASNSDVLSSKSSMLDEKEKRLNTYQFKIQQKQSYLDQMGAILAKLNQTAPDTSIDASPDMYIWDDDVEGDTDDYYSDYYTGDDDWMNDEEWY